MGFTFTCRALTLLSKVTYISMFFIRMGNNIAFESLNN